MTELQLIAALSKRLPAIGDDCAIVPHGKEDLLLKADMFIEDVHFRREERTAADCGYRALARALSDIAAMGGTPRWAMIALAMAPWTNAKWVSGFYDGALTLARRHGVEIVGGDISHAGKLVVDVSLAGVVPRGKALRRDTARAGDILYVSGKLGAQRWRFEPRLELGRQLRGRATACMDLSDGLALDLHRLAFSSGLEAVIRQVPVAVRRGATLETALHYGEDYELLFACPPRRHAPPGSLPIGVLVKGSRPGRVVLDGREVPQVGYDHLRQQA